MAAKKGKKRNPPNPTTALERAKTRGEMAESLYTSEREEMIERITYRMARYMRQAEFNWYAANPTVEYFDLWKDIERVHTADEPEWLLAIMERCEGNGVDLTPLEMELLPERWLVQRIGSDPNEPLTDIIDRFEARAKARGNANLKRGKAKSPKG